MKRTRNDSDRKLVVKRETLRALVSLNPDELARAAGGFYSTCCPGGSGVGTGSKYC